MVHPRLTDTYDFNKAKSHVYGLAHNVCLDKVEQDALIATLHSVEEDLIKDGESNERIIAILLDVILSGLHYGNWPWTTVKLPGK